MTSTASATNVDAHAVNTMRWLSAPETTIVVPVYQRQYRWEIGGCEQLLGDVLAVAGTADHQTHFIGSILSTRSAEHGDAELVLIDGQQRVTTLMLLVAALHHTVRDHDPELADELARVLVRHDDSGRTKLQPHRAWADVFERVVLEKEPDAAAGDARDSRFDDNYAFFRSRVNLDDAELIWRGLQRLEHVAIELGGHANAQQTFESLNSTGEPLRDHELIHNYVLMGLSHDEQLEIEDGTWLPIERDTGDQIAAFWRDYLVMITGREVVVEGGRGVYDAFRQRFPRLDLTTLRAQADEWRAHAAVYRVLLDPSQEGDAELARELTGINELGRTAYPLVLGAVRELRLGLAGRDEVLLLLRRIQSLLLRRQVSGIGTERLVARLCRARQDGPDALIRAMVRITPSDERVRVALKYSELPHPAYVLGRLADLPDPSAFEVEHVLPLVPGDDWTGDSVRRFADYSDDEQNSARALATTLGNLTLIEADAFERVFDASFPDKRDVYAASAVPQTRALAGAEAWSTSAIGARTVELTELFLRVWPRAGEGLPDDDGLTPLLDAKRRRGWPRGWQREWDYTEYRGEHWEVHDVRALFNRVFKRLWADARPAVVAYSARRGGPVYDAMSWTGAWDALDESHFLYMGWDSRYMLTAVQGLLEEAGIASEVFVKYSYIGEAM